MVKFLVERGADIDHGERIIETVLLPYLMEEEDQCAKVRLISTGHSNGCTAFWLACSAGYTTIARWVCPCRRLM
jgi:hypothetical protein